MGGAGGMPDWLFATLFAAGLLLVVGAFAWRNTARRIARTSARRPSPTRAEFLALMSGEISERTAQFLWDAATDTLPASLTPHPDDHLARDLPIAEEDWSIHWPKEYAAQTGLDAEELAEWPEGWEPTVRNFGKWLDMARG